MFADRFAERSKRCVLTSLMSSTAEKPVFATFALPPGSQEIILAVAMILILIFRPAGLMAGREVMLPARWVAGRTKPEN